MAAVQAEDVRASFLFVDDLNGHHQEWLGSTTTNRHGVAAFDFATVFGSDQLVVCPTHARGGTLDLLITDFPDLIRVAVVAPIDNSDHSSLSAIVLMALAVPNLCVTRKVFLKHQINWNTVCGARQDLPWRNILHADPVFDRSDLADPVSMVWAWRVSKAGSMVFNLLYLYYSLLLFFPFSSLRL